jgi:hypothetical protein
VVAEWDAVLGTEKLLVKEADNSISASLKAEEDLAPGSTVPAKQIVITERADLMNSSTIAGLSPELPNQYNISKSKFHNSAHKIDPVVDAPLKQKADDIIANGDNLGTKTEEVQDILFVNKAGYAKLDAKYGSNNGIDGLYIKGTVNNPAEIMVCEAKQWQSGGGVSLNQGNLNTGLPTQMSIDWVRYVAEKLKQTGIPEKVAIGDMLLLHTTPNGIVKRNITVVNKQTGDINILNLGIY